MIRITIYSKVETLKNLLDSFAYTKLFKHRVLGGDVDVAGHSKFAALSLLMTFAVVRPERMHRTEREHTNCEK